MQPEVFLTGSLTGKELFGDSGTPMPDQETAAPWFARLRIGLRATRRQYLVYLGVFFVWGMVANQLGKLSAIAEFRHWWQVLTCYLGYLVPVSLLLRRKSTFEQYVYGVFALAPLELAGYALGSSIAHDNNVIDQLLGPRNFTLFMSVFFGIIPPVGNAIVRYLSEQNLVAREESALPVNGVRP